jgi:exopolysaccharide biosynthesis polyprenyl glycosylphosphotransferase
MRGGWRYRVTSILGTAVLTMVAIVAGNARPVQETFAAVPYFGRPAPAVLSGEELLLAVVTALVVVLASAWPLFKPEPRRTLDAGLETQRRVVIAMVGLAALGYFNYTYRLPRSTLMLATAGLLVALPAFIVAIRRRPRSGERALLVGDDAEAMQTVLGAVTQPVVGYAGPSSLSGASFAADGEPVERVGGLSRIRDVIVDTDVEVVLLAFSSSDRAEFFGTLEACHQHGIETTVHRDHASHVLTSPIDGGELLAVDLEPWDWQDRVVKRAFDIAFAGTVLVILTPVVAAIAVAVRVDSPGSVLYSQQRTAAFGETFRVYKFRSMIADAEAETGATVSPEDAGGTDPRVTRIGRTLRRTHLDEIPQLWSILVGDMSVVGPRPERPQLDDEMEQQYDVGQWRRRWFVKPGLTGLAQIRGATGTDPKAKLRYDIEYIRRQSFWFDLRIVIRQLWRVGLDCVALLRERRNTAEHANRNTTEHTDTDDSEQSAIGNAADDRQPREAEQ